MIKEKIEGILNFLNSFPNQTNLNFSLNLKISLVLLSLFQGFYRNLLAKKTEKELKQGKKYFKIIIYLSFFFQLSL
jgi:hypothetical protein